MKKKLKELLSKKIFYVILALILVGVVEIVYASNLINSKNVSYSNSSSKLNSNNVQGAIDELYNSCKDVKETCPTGYDCRKIEKTTDLKKLVVTSGDGLYQDSVETNKYFYRGKNPNNYIIFSGNMYRIININSDGTIRIISNLPVASLPFDPGYSTVIDGITYQNSTVGTRYSSNTSDYCGYTGETNYSGCNVWGSSKTMRDSKGKLITKMPRELNSSTTYTLPDKEAYINTYLNTTWYQALTDTDLIKKDVTYNIGLVTNTSSNQTFETDLEQEKRYTWQGNIGLMQITDYPRTNTNQSLCGTINDNNKSHNNFSTCKNTSWLFYDNHNNQWTITLNEYKLARHVWTIFFTGMTGGAGASADALDGFFDVRPVLTLESNLSLIGNGSIDNPYQII